MLSDDQLQTTFIINVGNSSRRDEHACASQSDAVGFGAIFNVSCPAIGRYISVVQNGGNDTQVAALCEVVVIGNKYISGYTG